MKCYIYHKLLNVRLNILPEIILKKLRFNEFPADPGTRICTFTAEGPGSIPGWGTKIPQLSRHEEKIKKLRFKIVYAL